MTKVFRTNLRDMDFLNGREVLASTPLDPDAYDAEEVGPMLVCMVKGYPHPVHAFADEVVIES